jgi:hypothetical protein
MALAIRPLAHNDVAQKARVKLPLSDSLQNMKISEAFNRLWRNAPGKPRPTPTFTLHDPDAKRPHDLDDPFFEQAVRDRMGHIISKATKK